MCCTVRDKRETLYHITAARFNYALNLALADKQPLGKMADMCEFMGLDVIKWLWGSKPPDINFASYVGVVLKDLQLLHDSLIPMRKL
jgi:hypothetical protein